MLLLIFRPFDLTHKVTVAGQTGVVSDIGLFATTMLTADNEVIIVPNGALHYMPFQALKNAQGFLIQRHAISLAPSASVAVQLVRRQQHIASNLVAFGNPRIGPEYELPSAEAEGRAIGLGQHSIRGRDGETGPRKKGDIGFASLRGGTVVGDESE